MFFGVLIMLFVWHQQVVRLTAVLFKIQKGNSEKKQGAYSA